MENEFQWFQESFLKLKGTLESHLVGMDSTLNQLLIGVFSGGHILLEGTPGLGKTSMVRTLCQCLNLQFSRIQFTPDLMPADILGTHIIVETEKGKQFQFRKGPIFGNCILADEINRATPKTQSALLEAMEERTVSIAREVYQMSKPFLVIATQNPIEMEGTYPLPEAQLDRFLFKIELKIGDLSDICSIIDLHAQGNESPKIKEVFPGEKLPELSQISRKVVIAPFLKEMIGKIILGTHPDPKNPSEKIRKYVKFGSGPRGALAIALCAKVCALTHGRTSVSMEDIREILLPTLRHRIILNFQGEAEGVTSDQILQQLAEDYLK